MTLAGVEVAAIENALAGTGLSATPTDGAVWVQLASQTYRDSSGSQQIMIAVAPRSDDVVSLWLVPDLAPPEFSLGDPPDPALMRAVVAYQWDNQLARFQLGDDGVLQANIDILVSANGIEQSALVLSLEILVRAVDGLIQQMRAATGQRASSAATGFLSETSPVGRPSADRVQPADDRGDNKADLSGNTPPIESVRDLAREAAANPSRPPEPCNSLSTHTETVEEPSKGLFKRSQTVDRPATEVSETHFLGWLLWEQDVTSRTYVQPFSVEETSLEIWLTSEGELMSVQISSGGAYLEGKGRYPYRKVEQAHRATDEDLAKAGCGWQAVDQGSTPAIMKDTEWVQNPSADDPNLAGLKAAVRSVRIGGSSDWADLRAVLIDASWTEYNDPLIAVNIDVGRGRTQVAVCGPWGDSSLLVSSVASQDASDLDRVADAVARRNLTCEVGVIGDWVCLSSQMFIASCDVDAINREAISVATAADEIEEELFGTDLL